MDKLHNDKIIMLIAIYSFWLKYSERISRILQPRPHSKIKENQINCLLYEQYIVYLSD